MEIREIDQAGFLFQLRIGFALITIQREIRSARCFANHDHGEFGASALRVLCVQADRLQHGQLGAAQQARRRLKIIGRRQQVAQFSMVAQQGGKILVIAKRNETGGQQTRCNDGATHQHFARQGTKRNRRAPEQPQRQDCEQQQIQRHFEGQQVKRFARIGFKRIADHGAVDHHAVLVHEIGNRRRDEQKHADRRLEDIRQSQQTERQIQQQKQHRQRQRDKAPVAQGGRLADLQQVLPERQIAKQQQKKRGQRAGLFGSQGFNAHGVLLEPETKPSTAQKG